MIKGPGEAEGIENQEVSLTCTAEGLPDPKYDFYKVLAPTFIKSVSSLSLYID